MRKVIFFSTISFLLLLTISVTFAQWETIHPGGGGQVQGIAFGPNTPGKVFEISDMEGVNISHDYGDSWHNAGADRMYHLMQFTVTVEPGNPSRVYAGGLMGLEISDDGGETWRYVEWFYPAVRSYDRGAVAAIAVDPNNVDYVYAAHGWNGKPDGHLGRGEVDQDADGPRRIAVSHDRGKTWKAVNYVPGNGHKKCYSVQVHPNNGDVYLAAGCGIYRSTDHGNSWEKIAVPAGSSGECSGLGLSAGGEYIYATYRTGNDRYEVFAARTETQNWQNVSKGLPVDGDQRWRPAVDPRDTSYTHHVLVGGTGGSVGLWEGTVTWEDENITGISWEEIFDKKGGKWTYDAGLFPNNDKCRQYGYTPANWPFKIWVTDDQNLFAGDPRSESKYTTWDPRWTKNLGGGYYTSRGYESTFNWDMDGFDNSEKSYIIQGLADNGVFQSWDAGKSWKRQNPPGGNDCSGIEIIPVDPPVVLTGSVWNYGGGVPSNTGTFWAKKLVKYNETDRWLKIGGGDKGLNGLKKSNGEGPRIYSTVYDPFDKNRIYVGTEDGVFRHDAIIELVNGQGPDFVNIKGHSSVRKLAVDPNVEGRLYVLDRSGTFRCDNADHTSPQWVKIHDASNGGMNAGKDLDAFDNNGTTCIVIGSGDKIYLSNDGGDTFSKVLDQAAVLGVHGPALEPWFSVQKHSVQFSAVTGFKDRIYAFAEGPNRHGYAALEGTISNGTTVIWNDFSGTGAGKIYQPRGRRAKVFSTDGTLYVTLAAGGTGLWRREIRKGSAGVGRRKSPASEYALYQNYPNPFNPWTAIRYRVPGRAHVELSVYSLTGRCVAVLVNAVQNKGTRSVMWDGTDTFGDAVGSGVFFYRIKADDYVNFKKMTLLK